MFYYVNRNNHPTTTSQSDLPLGLINNGNALKASFDYTAPTGGNDIKLASRPHQDFASTIKLYYGHQAQLCHDTQVRF